MKIFIIGGTGLLGSEAARELINRGHEVSSMALPPIPTGAVLPEKMHIELGNYLDMTEEDIRAHFAGCDAFVFAAGVDERVEGPAPIYDMFRKYNIDPLKRLLTIAKESGVKHAVILGSYFSYFDKLWPKLELSKWHPYIRSRRDQEAVALAFADDTFDVAILELPYIFGTQPGRKPVWVFLVESLMKMKGVTLYTRGGTTMVTVKQVAQAVAGAVERNKGGKCYPIGYYNMPWKALLNVINRNIGHPNRKVLTIPDWTFAMNAKKIMAEQKALGHEGGLELVHYTKVQTSELFIDKSLGCELLGVKPDDIEAAIGDSVKLSLDVINQKVQVVGMKGE